MLTLHIVVETAETAEARSFDKVLCVNFVKGDLNGSVDEKADIDEHAALLANYSVCLPPHSMFDYLLSRIFLLCLYEILIVFGELLVDGHDLQLEDAETDVASEEAPRVIKEL